MVCYQRGLPRLVYNEKDLLVWEGAVTNECLEGMENSRADIR